MNTKTFKNRLLASSMIAGGLAVVAPSAIAQEDTEARQDTVVVTGSRIAKQDFVSNSPIATVDSEVFELTGSVNTEDVLNTLPQAIPGFDKASNNPGDGTATANLRGLGSSRTLVLVDGRRMVPSRADGVVDLNNIPASMIERVEVITGGASAVYGSDAMAGVVNFILKDDFEGFEANLGYEATLEYGDAEFYTGDVTVGANFDGDRGNVTMNMSYTNRKDVFAGDRPFSATIPGGGGSSGVPAGHSFDTFDFTALQGADPTNCPEGTANVNGACLGQAIFDGPDGIRPWINGGANSDRYNYAPVNYLQLPQERYATTTIARYEINDSAEVYGRFTGAFNSVPQILAPTPAFTSVTTGIDNPFLSPTAQAAFAQLDTDGDGFATSYIGRRMVETGGRKSNDDRFAFQFQVGLQGALTDSVDYDVYFQSGRAQNNNDLEGDISLTRYLDAANVIDDGTGQPVCASGNAACVPMNIFGEGNISQAAANYVSLRLNTKLQYDQKVFGASLTGDTEGLFSLPGGPVGWAAGLEYREEEFDFRPSDALAQGALLGFNAAPPVSGGFDTYDVYGEFYAPILKDVAGAQNLALEGAYRVSNYSTVGQTEAYKIGGEWAPIESLRFRTLFNTAVRAPNVAELFSPQSNGFPGAQDPCSTTNNPVAAGIAALCTATGVANVGDSGTGPANPAFFQQRNDQVQSLFNGVNPNLKQEKAETLTVGFVFEPAFLSGFVASLDYYDIEITDYITAFGGGAQGVFDQCYGSSFNPDQDPNNPFCVAVNRNATGPGGEALPLLPNANSGSLQTSGFDIAANYDFEVGSIPGGFSVGYAGLILDSWDFQASAASAVQDCKGKYGNFCGNPIADYKHNATFGWDNGVYSTQLRWSYIGEVDDDAGGPSLDGISYFNLNGSWDINDNLRLSGGIDNLLDEDPGLQLGSNAEQANTFPSTYDVFGRTVYVNAKVRF